MQLVDGSPYIKKAPGQEDMMTEKTRRTGRPPNAEAGEALKAAALRLVREQGYDGVSISAIATAAGVARQTLYNRWATKADLVLEAVFEETARYADRPAPDPQAPAADQLRVFLTGVFAHLGRDGDTLRALIAAAQQDPSFGEAFRTRFVQPREEMVTEILSRARERGELPEGRSPRLMSEFIHGAFWYRLLNGQPVDDALAQQITDAVFA